MLFSVSSDLPDSDNFNLLRQLVHRQLLQIMEARGTEVIYDDHTLVQQIDWLINDIRKRRHQKLSRDEISRLRKEVVDEVRGLGPLAPLMAEPDISDILINGPKEVWVDRGGRLMRTSIVFDDARHLRRIVDRMVMAQGKQLDAASPSVDSKLPDGSRLHAVIEPLCANGPVVSIRRFRQHALMDGELIEGGFLNEAMLACLKLAVQARLNIVVSGGAAAGKTTFLNYLSGFIPDVERIVTVEETAELKLDHPHVVSLEARAPNLEGRGGVALRDLVKTALRMRADRIIVGEVRGEEAFDMLQAMNVGHDGSLTTIHANSAEDVLYRLESLVLMSDVRLPRDAVREMVGSAIRLVVHLTRFRDGQRRITSLREVVRDDDRTFTRELFAFKGRAVTRSGQVVGEHEQVNSPHFIEDLKQRGYLSPSSA